MRIRLPKKEEVAAKFKETLSKGGQFKRPLLEFSGACAGCGRNSLCKTGHSAVRRSYVYRQRHRVVLPSGGGSAPSSLYRKPQGPWSGLGKLLFEDNAEYGLGMTLAQNAIRGRLQSMWRIAELTNDSGHEERL